MPSDLRLFVAVEPPGATAAAAARVIERLRRAGVVARWVDPAQLHVTLHFLGDVPATDLPALCRALDAAGGRSGPFEVAIGGVGAFPDAARPRTLWLGVRAGAAGLVALHAALAAELEPLGFPTEERRFVPHVTIGRVQGGRGGGRGWSGRPPADGPRGDAAALAAEIARLADLDAGSAEVATVALISSRLERAGPVHEIIHTADLTG
jgi:RNA 2',3'-cyclic 3'-phosphodiesterase